MIATLPLARRLAAWLVAFFSPTAYFLGLLFAARLPMTSRLPGVLVASLFWVIPVVALLICESLVWSTRLTIGWKIAAMVFTLLASVLQSVIIVVVLSAILVTAIAYPQ